MLLKAVPDLEGLVLDEVRGRIDRAAGELRLNPFDARALAVALALRSPGEPLVALSMGPPGATTVLREALAAGVDRAVLVSDPALAGSDAQVTSAVLARAVAAVRADLVLAGARSTDAETGQVPLELAHRLGWPALAEARRIDRRAGRPEFDVVVDRDDGWARYTIAAPAVLAVGEKIAKPPKPDEAARAAAEVAPIERWDASRLGFAAPELGAAGSPTVVVGLGEAAPDRSGRRLSDGPVEARVAEALGGRGAPDRRRTDPPLPAPAPRPPGGAQALVLASDEDGSVLPGATHLLAELARSLPGLRRTAVVAADSVPGTDRRRLAGAGAETVVHLVAPPGSVPAEGVARGLANWARSAEGVEVGLLPSTEFGRDVAARWAVEASTGLIGDVARFGPAPDGAVDWWKPAFGGAREARIRSRRVPTLVTSTPELFEPPPTAAPGDVRLIEGPKLPVVERAPVRAARGSERVPEYGDLASARRVITVGMGIGGPSGIADLLPYLARWDAALGATRRVVDAGWVPARYQVGLTGRAAAPELALLLGVGKAANHVIGLRRAGRIVAVNPDPEAPVFRYADAGIVADWRAALPALDRALSGTSAPARG